MGRPGYFYLGLRNHLIFLEYSFIARRYGRSWDYRPCVGMSIAVANGGCVTPLGEQRASGEIHIEDGYDWKRPWPKTLW